MIYYESSYTGITPLGDYIQHYAVKGQKKGVRRWQNEDGSYTAAGAANGGRYAPDSAAGNKREAKLAKYKTKENKKLDKRYDKKIGKLERKSEKLAEKYEKAADKGASHGKLNKIANKYEKYSRKQHERQDSKAAEKKRIDSSDYKQMKRDKAKIRRKATAGYLLRGGGAAGLVWQAARRGKYKERIRISKRSRQEIKRSSVVQAAHDRAALERRKIKRR